MKKILVIIASLCLSMAAFATGSTSISVNSTAGGLATAIASAGGDLSTVTNLTVTGEIDARDFKTMHDNMSALTDIDLSGASVAAFTGTGGTRNFSDSYLANEIPYEAFDSKSILKTVILPNTVTSLSTYSFWGCSSLTSVTLPNTLISISSGVFSRCTRLISLYIPTLVTSLQNVGIPSSCIVTIDPNNQYYCSVDDIVYNKSKTQLISCPITKTGALNLPSTLTSIPSSAFSDCIGLSSVVIPNSVTSIGFYAFSGCSGITSINIPNSVSTINSHAFAGTGLTSVTIPASVSSLAVNAFPANCKLTIDANSQAYSMEDDILYNKGKTQLISCPKSKTGVVNLPNTLTSIPSSAFESCTGLSLITIPNSVTSIGSSAFKGCTGLNSVIIPNSVTSIGSSAFEGCTSLSSITIPNTITRIESFSFEGCTNLSSVPIPNSVTSIGYSAFSGCTGLSLITIPNSVTRIESFSFAGCTGLSSVIIPKSVTSIGYQSFSGILNASFYISSSKIHIDREAFYSSNNSNIYTDCDTLTLSPYGYYKSQNKLFISAKTNVIDNPLGLKYLGDKYEIDASNNSYFTDGLVVYDKNKTELLVASTRCIDAYEIPSTVTSIKAGAFAYCDSLTSIKLPAGLTSIGDTAFYGCGVLKSMYSYSVMPPVLSHSNFYTPAPFAGIDTMSCILYVPKGAKAAYSSTRYWQGFKNIVEMEDNTSAAANASQTALKVQVRNGKLIVDGAAEDMDVAVYNMQGIQVASTKASGAELEINLPSKGIYVVRVGTQSIKVLN